MFEDPYAQQKKTSELSVEEIALLNEMQDQEAQKEAREDIEKHEQGTEEKRFDDPREVIRRMGVKQKGGADWN
jgi:hypothetical protein